MRDSLAPRYHGPELQSLRREAERLYELMAREATS
jgi:hypothetical protein